MPNELIIAKPYPPQEAFYLATARRVAYGGARGGGKSFALRQKLSMLASYYPGIQILLLRRTFPELSENHILPLRRMLNGIAVYRDTNKEFTFPNGSRIKCGYLAAESDVLQYQGQAYEVIAMDEATQFSETQYRAMTECNRLSGNMVDVFVPRMYFTCNPGGVGHAWVKRLFIDRNYTALENPDDYQFIQARVYDNAFLMENDPEYVRNLEALPPKRRAAMLDGRWDVFEGQFFDSFLDNPDGYKTGIHTNVIDRPDPADMSDWRLYRAFDWGFSAPFAVSYWSVDFNNRAYCISEIYGCDGEPNVGIKKPPQEIFRMIQEHEANNPVLAGKDITGVADPAIWQSQTGESIAEVGEKMGVGFLKGDNARISGWQQVQKRMAMDETDRPHLYVCRNCKNMIRTIPQMIYSARVPEDLDTTLEDHLCDTMRYFCMLRPMSPSKIEEAPKYNDYLDFAKDGFVS